MTENAESLLGNVCLLIEKGFFFPLMAWKNNIINSKVFVKVLSEEKEYICSGWYFGYDFQEIPDDIDQIDDKESNHNEPPTL